MVVSQNRGENDEIAISLNMLVVETNYFQITFSLKDTPHISKLADLESTEPEPTISENVYKSFKRTFYCIYKKF